MVTSIRQLDRGACLSVNGTRELSISNLWRLACSDFCDCAVTDFLAEGFVELGVDPPDIEVRFDGRCVQCGDSGTTDWLTVGRIVDSDDRDFLGVDSAGVHIPEKRTRLATPR